MGTELDTLCHLHSPEIVSTKAPIGLLSLIFVNCDERIGGGMLRALCAGSNGAPRSFARSKVMP
jgi:hypothetical protein